MPRAPDEAGAIAITDALRSAVTHYIEWRALENVQTGLSFRQYFAQQANDMFSPAATELEKSLAAPWNRFQTGTRCS